MFSPFEAMTQSIITEGRCLAMDPKLSMHIILLVDNWIDNEGFFFSSDKKWEFNCLETSGHWESDDNALDVVLAYGQWAGALPCTSISYCPLPWWPWTLATKMLFIMSIIILGYGSPLKAFLTKSTFLVTFLEAMSLCTCQAV